MEAVNPTNGHARYPMVDYCYNNNNENGVNEMISQTAHHTPYPNHYAVKDNNGELVATLAPASKDANIMRIVWVGGASHGRTELTEGGLEGAMSFIGEKLAQTELF